MGKMLKITLIHSYIGRPEAQRRVLRGMGLGKVNRSVVLNDTPEIRGMIRRSITWWLRWKLRGKGNEFGNIEAAGRFAEKEKEGRSRRRFGTRRYGR